MITIWKHTFKFEDQYNEVELPLGSRYVSGMFNDQTSEIMLWYEVDTSNKKTTVYRFSVVGTGWDQNRPKQEHWEHLFTFTQQAYSSESVEGSQVVVKVPLFRMLVWHVYERWNKMTGE